MIAALNTIEIVTDGWQRIASPPRIC